MVCFSLASLIRSPGKESTSSISSTSSTLPEDVHRMQLPEHRHLYGVTFGAYPGVPGLLVIDTGSCPVVREWNHGNPNQRIEVGHAVLEVNGITDPNDMLKEFRTATSVSMLVKTELTPRQRTVFQQSVQVHKSRAVDEILQTVDIQGCPDDVCAICHDDLDQPDSNLAQLPCGHHFHRTCVRKWLVSGKPRCPLCNHNVRDKVCQKVCKEVTEEIVSESL